MEEHHENIPEVTNSSPLPEPTFAQDERGQISVFVVLCLIPFVFLVAFVFNTAKQTTRKIEMQGAADATAVASAVTMARGMNLMVLNNNAMAEVLSLMIVVRSMKNTAAIFFQLNTAAAALSVAVPPVAAYFAQEALKWKAAELFWKVIDAVVIRIGWLTTKLLDVFNRIIKLSFPAWAIYQSAAYAHKNTANQFPFGFVQPGASALNLPLIRGLTLSAPAPTFPVARGPEQTIADRAYNCQFKLLHRLAGLMFLFVDPIQGAVAAGVYLLVVEINFTVLRGGLDFLERVVETIKSKLFAFVDEVVDWLVPDILGPFGNLLGDLASSAFGFVIDILGEVLGIELLTWPDNPPKPMLLTDAPSLNPSDTTDEREVRDLEGVQPYLQYLGFALGKVPRGSPIGGERFLNRPNSLLQVQFTYAQAEVYNPEKWDMWTQDWRAQLTRAKLFDEKANFPFKVMEEVFKELDLPYFNDGLNWSFVNTH